MKKQTHTIPKIDTANMPTHPVKITPRQRLAIIKIGSDAGLQWTYQVIDLLIHRYNSEKSNA
jgi:hypothetical protein